GTIIFNNSVLTNGETGISIYYSPNAEVLENVVNGNQGAGIWFDSSDYGTITDNSVGDNSAGIGIWNSSYIDISFNTVFGNEWEGIAVRKSSNVIVTFNHVYNNGGQGIWGENSGNCVFTDNEVYNNQGGIGLINSTNNMVSSNTAYENELSGIFLNDFANDNEISENTLYDNRWGIYVRLSSGCTISDNHVSYNTGMGLILTRSGNNYVIDNVFQNDGIYLFGLTLEQCIQSEVTGNSVNGKPIVFRQNIQGERIPSGAGQVFLVNCSEIEVSGQTFSDAHIGLFATFCTNLQIQSNRFYNNLAEGFWLWNTTDVTVFNNTIFNNGYDGIGIYNCTSIEILYNNITSNLNHGIYVGYSSDNCTIAYNEFNSNNFYGVFVENADLTQVIWNFFFDNNLGGTSQAFDEGSETKILKNHWNEWTSPDIDGDGIVDVPYSIDGILANEDPFPIVTPGFWFDYTGEGEDITLENPFTNVRITFESVSIEGIISINKSDFDFLDPIDLNSTEIQHEIRSNATYAGTIIIVIPFSELDLLREEQNLKLMQWNPTLDVWEEITTWVDTTDNLIYGETTSLGLFSIMEPFYIINVDIEVYINQDGLITRNIEHNIPTTVDFDFDLRVDIKDPSEDPWVDILVRIDVDESIIVIVFVTVNVTIQNISDDVRMEVTTVIKDVDDVDIKIWSNIAEIMEDVDLEFDTKITNADNVWVELWSEINGVDKQVDVNSILDVVNSKSVDVFMNLATLNVEKICRIDNNIRVEEVENITIDIFSDNQYFSDDLDINIVVDVRDTNNAAVSMELQVSDVVGSVDILIDVEVDSNVMLATVSILIIVVSVGEDLFIRVDIAIIDLNAAVVEVESMNIGGVEDIIINID
ncbi:MAG: nitrous oxide reductase family maturation protein NosD, partial [Candidatus Hodarchaeota archaeon]